MQDLLKIIDSRINKNMNSSTPLKTSPCKVIEILSIDKVRVSLISSGAEYTVPNYSGSQVFIGETVQIYYKGTINPNSAYIGASLYKENKNDSDIDCSIKNIIMKCTTGILSADDNIIARTSILAKRSADVTIFFSTYINPGDTPDIRFSVLVDGIQQFYSPTVLPVSSHAIFPGFSLPVTLNKGNHVIEIHCTEITTAEQVCAYVSGQYIEEYSVLVYGCHIDKSDPDSSGAVAYLADAVGMTPAKMENGSFNYGSWKDAFFMPKPCMLKYDGTVAYYLDPDDYGKKLDGTPSDIANPDFEGNAMMEWGQLWYKFAGGADQDDSMSASFGEGFFYVSNQQVDESYHCWCNYNSRDEAAPHFYTAIYNSTLHEGRFRSLSGLALTRENGSGYTTGEQEITYCTANNITSDIEWYTGTYADRMLINALLVLMGKSLNTQAVFGRGLDTGNENAKKAYTTGSMDDKGLFWGDTANGNSGVKVFGMENWWGCIAHRTAGYVYVSSEHKIKLTYGTADGSTANGYNSTGDGYILMGTKSAMNGGVGGLSRLKYNEYGYIPFITGGSSSTYYGDYYEYRSNYALPLYLQMGGRAGTLERAGAFYFDFYSNFLFSSWAVSTTLSCKPIL